MWRTTTKCNEVDDEADDNEVDDEAVRHAASHARGGFGHGFANFGRARHIPIRGGGGFDADHNYQDGDEDMLFDMDDHQHGGHDGYRERRHANVDHRRDDDGLGKVKVSIPKFSGKEVLMIILSGRQGGSNL